MQNPLLSPLVDPDVVDVIREALMKPEYELSHTIRNNGRITCKLKETIQKYTLTPLNTVDEAIKFLRFPDSGKGLFMTENFRSQLCVQCKFTAGAPESGLPEDWIAYLSIKKLKSVIAVYNNLCTLAEKPKLRLGQAQIDKIGGIRRVTGLMLEYTETQYLLEHDLDEVLKDRVVSSPIPVEEEEEVQIQANEAGLKFAENCILCGASILNTIIVFFAKCVHRGAMHEECYVSNAEKFYRPTPTTQLEDFELKCPSSNCGWVYSKGNMISHTATSDLIENSPAPRAERTVKINGDAVTETILVE